ncbi:MAG: Fe-S cluster assembly protein SufD [Rhodospirillaceae bacterium]|nr:Fe-S cluster assembly protein SufD [Rhodospirillaceae bacterium]
MPDLIPISSPGAAPADWLAGWRTGPAATASETPEWLQSARSAAAGNFERMGLPSRRVEDWRYTSLASLAEQNLDWSPPSVDVTRESLPALVFGREADCRLVLVNGEVRPNLSSIPNLGDGVVLTSLSNALGEDDDRVLRFLRQQLAEDGSSLKILNDSWLLDGYVLIVPDDTTIDMPIEILSVGTGGVRPPAYQPRNLVIAGRRSHVTIVEYHIGLYIGSYFANIVTDIDVGPEAIVRHCKVQDESKEAIHLALYSARLDSSAQLDSFSFTLGSRISRNELRVRLEGLGAYCRLNGAYLVRENQHCDHTSVVSHASPETSSDQLYKGVLDGQASGVYQGKVVVHADAQKVEAHQMSRALLLSETSEVSTKPELKIHADDVQCSHGATAGELDAEALFYLRSRGIPEIRARQLLVEAFLNEAIDAVALAGMRLPLEQNVVRWMAERSGP